MLVGAKNLKQEQRKMRGHPIPEEELSLTDPEGNNPPGRRDLSQMGGEVSAQLLLEQVGKKRGHNTREGKSQQFNILQLAEELEVLGEKDSSRGDFFLPAEVRKASKSVVRPPKGKEFYIGVQNLQVQEVLLVASVFLLVILLAVSLCQCTLMGRRRAAIINTTDAEAQTDNAKEEKGGT